MGRKWNVAAFVGGPLDGCCWPCVLDPDQIVVKAKDGRLHCYETDLETEYEDGSKEYRMAYVLDLGSFVEEFREGLPAEWSREKRAE